MSRLIEIVQVYHGSDGERTKALYGELEGCGPAGVVALNLFRASKNSGRAKVYRGGERGRGSYRRMAYDRKTWAIDNLTRVLEQHASSLGVGWGWGIDRAQEFHRDVLYVDLPSGQVSFHTSPRGLGPDYPGQWDGQPGAGPQRICNFVAQVLEGGPA